MVAVGKSEVSEAKITALFLVFYRCIYAKRRFKSLIAISTPFTV